MSPSYATWPPGLLAALFGPDNVPDSFHIMPNGAYSVTLREQVRCIMPDTALHHALQEQLRREAQAKRIALVFAEGHYVFLAHAPQMAAFVLWNGRAPHVSFIGSPEHIKLPYLLAYALHAHDVASDTVEEIVRHGVTHLPPGVVMHEADGVTEKWRVVCVGIPNKLFNRIVLHDSAIRIQRHELERVGFQDPYSQLLTVFANEEESRRNLANFTRRYRR